MSQRSSFRRALAALALTAALPAALPHPAHAANWQVLRDAPRVQRYRSFVDPVRHRLFVVTEIGGGFEPAVWSIGLDPLSDWQREAEAVGPEELRDTPSLIADPASDRVLAFGGRRRWSSGDQLTNDLWSFELATPGNWRKLSHDDSGPLHGNSGAAVLDTRRNRLLAFGGDVSSVTRASTNRTWEFGQLARWEEISTTPPPSSRGWAAAAYDAVGDRMVVTGGFAGLAPPNTDTWELRFPANEWRQLANAGAAPSALGEYSWFSPSTRTLGYLEPGTVWTLDLARTDAAVWTARAIAGEARPSGGLPAWDDATQSIWQFEPESGDLWRLTLSGTPAWTVAKDIPAPPPSRYDGASIVTDPTTDRTYVLFGYAVGGPATTGMEVNATSLRGWRLFAVTPSPRTSASAVMDEANRRILVFGGRANGMALSDLWEYRTDMGTWSQLLPEGDAPGPRSGHSAVLDPEGRRMLVWGGMGPYPAGALNELWALALDGPPRWTRLDDAPIAGGQAVMWDAFRQRLLVTHGADVWTWNANSEPAWRNADSYGRAGLLQPLVAIPDHARGRLFLLGTTEWAYAVRVSQLDLATMAWQPYLAKEGPEFGSRLGYGDPARGRAVMLTGGGAPEVWTLPLTDPAAFARPSSSSASPHRVDVAWRMGGDPLPLRVLVEQELAEARVVGVAANGGVTRIADTQMVDDDTVSYSLQSSSAGEWTTINTVRVHVPKATIPPFTLALAPASMSVGSRLRIRCTLPDAQSARLEVFDVSGRRLAGQDVGANGPGEHTIYLEGDFHTGMYLVRLTHPQRVLNGRLVVLR